MESRKKDTFSYKGWIVSDYFLKRMFALLGYHVLGLIISYSVFGLGAVVIGVFLGFFSDHIIP